MGSKRELRLMSFGWKWSKSLQPVLVFCCCVSIASSNNADELAHSFCGIDSGMTRFFAPSLIGCCWEAFSSMTGEALPGSLAVGRFHFPAAVALRSPFSTSCPFAGDCSQVLVMWHPPHNPHPHLQSPPWKNCCALNSSLILNLWSVLSLTSIPRSHIIRSRKPG